MTRYSVFTCVLVFLSIVFGAIQQISAGCKAQPVASVTPRAEGKVGSSEGSGVDYDVYDLSACLACLEKVKTVKCLKSSIIHNPVIGGWDVTFKDSAGTIPYNLQKCEGHKGVDFWVKTTKFQSSYVAFYIG